MRGFRRRRRLWRDKVGVEEKNHIKRRVERQKFFSSPPATNQSSLYNTAFLFNRNKKFFPVKIFCVFLLGHKLICFLHFLSWYNFS